MTSSILTVSQVNFFLKSLIEGDGRLSDVLVTGEISNFTDHYRSGHLYFSLKDEKSVLKAVMFSSSARRLRFRPGDGMKVIIRGRVSVYEPTGQYQLYAEDMQPDGVGALSLAYEQLKEKLAREGLFDQDRKRPIPRYPAAIGWSPPPQGRRCGTSSRSPPGAGRQPGLSCARCWSRGREPPHSSSRRCGS